MVKNGKIDSLAILYEKYKVPMYNFFFRLTFDEGNSKDLTQNVFYRIIKYRHSYKEENKFRAWIYQLARNVNNDFYRKNKLRLDKYQNPEKLGEYLENNSEEEEKKERNIKLYEALSKLNKEQREIIELSRFQGLKFEEIAEITGSSSGAMRTKASRAMAKLRQIYFEDEE